MNIHVCLTIHSLFHENGKIFKVMCQSFWIKTYRSWLLQSSFFEFKLCKVNDILEIIVINSNEKDVAVGRSANVKFLA